MIPPEARARLAEKMDERRLELRLAWREVAEAGGISYEVIRNLRGGRGTGIAPLTKAGIEQGLHWEAGSVDRILAGGDPAPADPVLAEYIRGVRHELARAEARFGPGFTAEQAFPVPHEAATWRDEDGRMPDENKRIALIAGIRKLTDEYGSQASNTGLVRLVRAGHGHLPA